MTRKELINKLKGKTNEKEAGTILFLSNQKANI